MTFTVDALPGLVFHGQVGKIRLNATMSQNVVTYTVEVNTDNEDGKLLPYLTANVKFTVGHRQNVLLVPNAALRWLPRPNQIAPVDGDSLAAPGEVDSGREIALAQEMSLPKCVGSSGWSKTDWSCRSM